MTLNRTDNLEDSLDLACNAASESSSSSSCQAKGEETETVYETAARLLFMSVRWTKNLASFSALAQCDQAALLEESWAQLFLLCSIQWCSGPNSAPTSQAIFSSSEFPDLPAPLAETLALLRSSLEVFSQLNIDPAEFACMKAIVLFKPGGFTLSSILLISLPSSLSSDVSGLKDKAEVETLQDQSLNMLQHQVSTSLTRTNTRYAR